MRIEKDNAREFYLKESVEGNWSTRQLERQVNSHYFERMLMTREDSRSLVKQEADSKKDDRAGKETQVEPTKKRPASGNHPQWDSGRHEGQTLA